MKCNFEEKINRRGTHCIKWDSRSDIPADTIPLWVADMDFKVADPIVEAMQQRLDQRVFGYTCVPDEYYASIDNWFSKWHDWTICREQIIYTTGVVPAISAIVKALTKPGEKVLIQTPVYNCFFSCIRNNGCIALENSLKLEGKRYTIDFDDLEEKASDPECNLMVLCNPHNPAGRAWTKQELSRICEICGKHGVIVASDEIHCELVMPGHEYIPFAKIATGKWIACISPSKAFNIAGLQIANIVCSNAELRAKVDRAINDNEVCDVNPFGVEALMAAYNKSRYWLEALIPYIYNNYILLKESFERLAPSFPVIDLEATYLAWIDCRCLNIKSEELEELLIKEAHVWINPGSMYGKDGEGFIRVNLACPRQSIEKALSQMIPVLNSLVQ